MMPSRGGHLLLALAVFHCDSLVGETIKAKDADRCPLDVTVLWTSDVDAPVYSTPVIVPSSADGRKQVVVSTLRSAVESFEADGSIPPNWPVQLEGRSFFSSPAVHDLNGDGIPDVCVAASDGTIYGVLSTQSGPSVWNFKVNIPSVRVHEDDVKMTHTTTEEGPESQDKSGPPISAGGRRMLMGIGDEENERDVEDRLTSAHEQTDTNSAAENLAHTSPSTKNVDLSERSTREMDSMEDLDLTNEYTHAYWYGFEDDMNPYASMYDQHTYGAYYGMERRAQEGTFVIRPHILSAPVFVDVNGNGSKEMLISISYYLDDIERGEYSQSPEDFEGEALRYGNYIRGALACWSILDEQWLWHHDFESIFATDGNRGYVASSPTVADLEGDGNLEVLVGTVTGAVHVLSAMNGDAKPGFYYKMEGRIRAQIAVADVHDAPGLEMVVGDATGALVCIGADGQELWKTRLGGPIAQTAMMGDVDGDGLLDVVVGVRTASGEGEVWVLSARSGDRVPPFPKRLQNRKGISAPVLLVDLHEDTAGTRTGDSRVLSRLGLNGRLDRVPRGGTGPGLHLVVPSEDGHVYVIEGATGCTHKIDIGERLTGMVLADDLTGDGNLELIVGTIGGEVIALDTNVPFHPLNAWASEVRGGLNGFIYGKHQGVYFEGPSSRYENLLGRDFELSFQTLQGGHATKISRPLSKVALSAGANRAMITRSLPPGKHSEKLSFSAPGRVTIHVTMTTNHGLMSEDYIHVEYNTCFHSLLKWIVALPVALAAGPMLWLQHTSRQGSVRTQLPP